MTDLPQPSMSAGEISPGQYGRVDIARYQTGLKTCSRFTTRPSGGAIKDPGRYFRGFAKTDDLRTRFVPFIYSTEVNYLVEVGEAYFRFWVGGAPLAITGVPVEVAHPYLWDDLAAVRFTQSADVLYLVHPDYQQRELRRLTSTSFDLRLFGFKKGPFRPLNQTDSSVMAVSGTTGNVTITTNVDVFDPDMVGGLVYVEEKELRGVKPWTPLEKNVPLEAYRRSDLKTYQAVSVPDISGLTGGTPYYICGNTPPLHETGRAFDGPQDTRNDGVNDYKVGVEWKFIDGGFGVVKITGYTNARSVTGTVVSTVPKSIVGTAPAPVAGPWTLDGDGATKVFAVAGATSLSQEDYTVTIDGEPVQQDPYAPPITGGGGSIPSGPGGGGRDPL